MSSSTSLYYEVSTVYMCNNIVALTECLYNGAVEWEVKQWFWLVGIIAREREIWLIFSLQCNVPIEEENNI